MSEINTGKSIVGFGEGASPKPVETVVKLPSKGLVYAPPLNVTEVELTKFSTEHLDVIASEIYSQRGTTFDELLKRLIVNLEISRNVDNLLVGDKLQMLVGARLSIFGNIAPIKTECKHCHSMNQILDLNKLILNDLTLQPCEPNKNRFKFETQKGKKTIYFKFFTVADYREYMNFVSEKREKGELENTMTTKLYKHILEIDGVPEAGKAKFIRSDLHPADAIELFTYINDNEPMIIPEYTFTCPACKKSFEAKFGMDFFQLFFDIKAK